MTRHDAPRPEDGEAFVEYVRREFYIKKGDLYWRKREASRYVGSRFPERAAAQFNGRFGGKPAGKPFGKGKSKAGPRFVRLGARDWPVETLVRIVETGVMPEDETVSYGMAYVEDIIIGEGPLGLALKAARAASGLGLDDLTVLSHKYDPFRFDTPERHRDAAWFAELFTRLVAPGVTIHIRGFHYLLISAGGAAKPDGTPYRNTEDDYTFLGDAAKRARWLGYVAFDRIVDQRNDAPTEYRGARSVISTAGSSVSATLFRGSWQGSSFFTVSVGVPFVTLALGDEASLSPLACQPYPLQWGLDVEQPYCFAFFGEKSSLKEVLQPIAQQYGANLYLCSGEISDTLVYHMARDTDADGRPLVVFTFSDFDPAGHQMPISIGRKLQALRALEFSGLRAEVVPVSLTLEQVIAERLPTTFVKPKEKRRNKWDQAFGPALRAAGLATGGEPAQVEIDALAAIRPDVLRRITHEKIALYRDETIRQRVSAAENRWRRMAQSMIAAEVEGRRERLDEIEQAAEEAAKQFNEARQGLADAVSEAKEVFEKTCSEAQEVFENAIAQPKEDLDEARDRMSEVERDLELVVEQIHPPEPPEQLEAEIDIDRQAPIVRLDWSFEDATAALKARKAYAADEGGEDDEGDDEA